ncbi:hypothetical protein L9F63_012100, partial [Diploptera punctata]
HETVVLHREIRLATDHLVLKQEDSCFHDIAISNIVMFIVSHNSYEPFFDSTNRGNAMTSLDVGYVLIIREGSDGFRATRTALN